MGGVMYGDASRATASLPITLIALLFGAGHVGRSGLSCGAPNSPPVAAACDTLCCSCASRRAYASCDRSTILENYYSDGLSRPCWGHNSTERVRGACTPP